LITKHLLDGDDSFLRPDLGLGTHDLPSLEKFAIPEPPKPLSAGERPPIDPDAT
jgi:hypothetical protein